MNEQTDYPDRYYRPSGAVPVMATLTMLFGGMVTALLFGLISALINRWLPYAIVLLSMTVGYGAAVGGGVRFSARIAHVRHPGFTRFVAFAIGLFAVYIAWVWYMWVWSLQAFDPIANTRNFFWWFTNPGGIWNQIQVFVANGRWTVGGWTPKGATLYAIYTLEAGLYVFFAMAVAVNPSLTYCEDCRRWTDEKKKLAHMPLSDANALRTALEAEQYDILNELRSQPCDMNDRLDVSAAVCPTCTATTFLSVSRVKVSTDANGNPAENSQPIVRHLIVPRDIAEQMAIPVAPRPAANSDAQRPSQPAERPAAVE
jgi:hypothetical protein